MIIILNYRLSMFVIFIVLMGISNMATEQKWLPVPDPDGKERKRKCYWKSMCKHYGQCSIDCPSYLNERDSEKITEVDEFTINNEFLSHIDSESVRVLKNRPPFIQAIVAPPEIALCCAFFADQGYAYIDTILVNPTSPILLFGRNKK